MLEANFPQTLEAARAGTDSAWAAIYGDLAPVVLGYMRARGAGDPEDLVGEVFLQVVRDLHSFEGGEREFRAWVFVIAHHRLLDDARRRGRRPVELRREPQHDVVASGNVEDEALEQLATNGFRRILEQLAPDQRDVLLLRVLGDLTVQEVARVLGKRPGAVKALQRRGLEAVKRAVGSEGVTLWAIPALTRTTWDASRD